MTVYNICNIYYKNILQLVIRPLIMHENMSPAVRRVLRTLGEDMRTARRRRRITQTDLATRMGVSVGTVKRLEAGDSGLAIGSLAMALLAFGKIERLSELLPEHADDIGFMLDRENLPQRVRRRNPAASSENDGEPLYDRSPEGALF